MEKKVKTQAMRALDAHKIPYQVYIIPDTVHSADGVALHVGKPLDQIFKTLVVMHNDETNRHPMLVVTAGTHEINLRQLAHELGEKSVHMARQEQAEKLTGMKVGGISALGLLNRPFEVYLDAHATQFEELLVSAGQRGVQLQLKVSDFIHITKAKLTHATQTRE
jgi:Cys-tRNA(Pro)/Cys-tRNA(Cys) deacylase